MFNQFLESDYIVIQTENITKYIKKNGEKVGSIRANKMRLEPQKNCVVFIAHSKVNTDRDVFDKSMMFHILNSRFEFMYNMLKSNSKRTKQDTIVTKQVKQLYEELFKRSKMYFKDCDMIYSYIDMFDYSSGNYLREVKNDL